VFEQKDSLNNLRRVWRIGSFVVLVFWVVAMVSSLTFSAFGFSIPEILVSSEFMAVGCGFSFLYYSPVDGQRKIEEKAELIISILGLIVGLSILSLGVFVILFRTPNFFTPLCLIIGIVLTFLSAKPIRICFEVDRRKSWR
jgi:hypothetical protein